MKRNAQVNMSTIITNGVNFFLQVCQETCFSESTSLLANTNGSSSADFSSKTVSLTFPATAIPFIASCHDTKDYIEN